MDQMIQPLYFVYKIDQGNKPPRDLEICNSVTKTIEKENLRGVQRVGNLWRIYVNSVESRALLAASGFDFNNKHITLSTTNPYSMQNGDSDRPVKITLHDIHLYVDNEYIEQYLKGMGVQLVEPVTYARILDDERKETNFINGDRVTFVKAAYIRNNPLQPYLFIKGCVARIKHFGQHPRASVCTKCFCDSHPSWNCRNERACRVCRISGHAEGEEACPHYSREYTCLAFGGRDDRLSNFHRCNFEYNGQLYTTREQAFQHQKALFIGNKEIAETMLKMRDPSMIKKIAKCLPKSEEWIQIERRIFTEICLHAAKQDFAYEKALLDTEGSYLVEAVIGDFKWGSGINMYATGHTLLQHIPGENLMGKILMNVRDEILAERKQKSNTTRNIQNETIETLNNSALIERTETDETYEYESSNENKSALDDGDINNSKVQNQKKRLRHGSSPTDQINKQPVKRVQNDHTLVPGSQRGKGGRGGLSASKPKQPTIASYYTTPPKQSSQNVRGTNPKVPATKPTQNNNKQSPMINKSKTERNKGNVLLHDEDTKLSKQDTNTFGQVRTFEQEQNEYDADRNIQTPQDVEDYGGKNVFQHVNDW